MAWITPADLRAQVESLSRILIPADLNGVSGAGFAPVHSAS